MTYTIVFDPDSHISYGWWECHECGSKFYGGGRAMHRSGCKMEGYVGLIYHYSANERDGAIAGYAPNSPAGFIEKITSQQVK